MDSPPAGFGAPPEWAAPGPRRVDEREPAGPVAATVLGGALGLFRLIDDGAERQTTSSDLTNLNYCGVARAFKG